MVFIDNFCNFLQNGEANSEFFTKSIFFLIIARYEYRPLSNLWLAVLQPKSQNPLRIAHCYCKPKFLIKCQFSFLIWIPRYLFIIKCLVYWFWKIIVWLGNDCLKTVICKKLSKFWKISHKIEHISKTVRPTESYIHFLDTSQDVKRGY